MTGFPRGALRLVTGAHELIRPVEWTWFCGHCAAPSPFVGAPPPTARVCPACGLGLLLETLHAVVPSSREAFLVIDSALRVQAVSRCAERLLGVREDTAVDRLVTELLVGADADADVSGGFGAALAEAAAGDDGPRRIHVRPANTYGVRLRARVASCGPPRAVLLVIDGPQSVGA